MNAASTSIEPRRGEGILVFCDVTSACVEGRCCPLAAFGCNRDRKRGKRRIVRGRRLPRRDQGLRRQHRRCDHCQVQTLRKRFGIRRVALVADRGML
ncbi:MAG: hypothetical protein OXH99_09045 [Bryobacterales bacterium]|nr:hypothetical protein [Bryobacterales bacterium]